MSTGKVKKDSAAVLLG